MVDGAVPEFFVKVNWQCVQFAQFKHHTADCNGIRFHLVPLPLQCCQFGFGFLKATAQFGVGGAVVFFGHGIGCVFFNAKAQHFGNGSQFLFQSPNVLVDKIRIRKHPLGIAQPDNDGLPVGKIRPKGRQEQFFQPFLGQVGRFAFVFPLKFVVTLPDDPAVTVGGVPGLGTENPAAVGTVDLPGEGAGLTVPIAAVFTPLQLRLHLFPFPRLNDGRVAILHIVLRRFALVDLGFLGEEIHRKGFLKQCGAFVFLVPQGALHGGSLPNGPLAGSGNPLLRQHGGNGVGGFPLKKFAVDTPDDLRLLRNDFRQTIRTFAIAQKLAVRDADFPVGEALSLPPGNIFGDAAAFLLGKARHDGDEQFPFGVEGHDILFLKEALATGLLQLADGGQTVHGVSGETADGFGHDQVDLSGKGIPDHPVKAVTVFGVDGTDTLVGIDLHEVPIRIFPDEFGVIVHLGFVGSELFFAVRGDTGISRYPAANPLLGRCFGMDIQCGGDDGDIFSFRHGAASFPVFSLRRPGAFPLSNSRHGSGPATASRRWFRP